MRASSQITSSTIQQWQLSKSNLIEVTYIILHSNVKWIRQKRHLILSKIFEKTHFFSDLLLLSWSINIKENVIGFYQFSVSRMQWPKLYYKKKIVPIHSCTLMRMLGIQLNWSHFNLNRMHSALRIGSPNNNITVEQGGRPYIFIIYSSFLITRRNWRFTILIENIMHEVPI